MCAKIVNPILPGFYPDPSVCVADGFYYLVNSTFSYFPGIPVFRSKDCVKWEQIGNIIDRPDQLDFTGAGVSRGLFAPTIRYNNGKFYCICTQVDKLGNFFVTADNPEGPWSKPVAINGAEGIDPSLFFDDDGTVWYTGTRPAPEGPAYNGNWEIWVQRINLSDGTLYGEAKGIWRGALKNCVWPEGPHIYKVNGLYYLIHAEGGTGPDHAVCVARSDKIDGDWEGKKSNPILTHRHLGMGAGVVYVGHADLFCDNSKRWWMVCLASRPYGGAGNGRFCNLGRETFLVPVKWEDGWPLVSWETGLVENVYDTFGHVSKRTENDSYAVKFPEIDDFNDKKLAAYWLGLREINPDYVTLLEQPGTLRLYGQEPLGLNGHVTLIARRQTGFSFEASTRLKTHFENEGDVAGLICFQNEDFFYKLQIKKRGKMTVCQLIKSVGKHTEVLAEDGLTGGSSELVYVLRVVAEKQKMNFQFGVDERSMNLLAEDIDASILSVEKAGGFVGTVIGMFAETEENPANKTCYADFDWFQYVNIGREWISKN